ncbi:MAG: M43 family zinc metalloprotease, partial [Catalinimonas sp.]
MLFFTLRARVLSALVLLASVSVAHAQSATTPDERCATVRMDSLLHAKHPHLPNQTQFEAWMAEQRAARQVASTNDESYPLVRIPVIVHVVHDGEPVGTGPNISAEQVYSQIEVLNEDFRRLPGTPGFNDNPVGADAFIEFVPATIDTNGLLLDEPGIRRYDGGRFNWSTDDIDGELKPATFWNPSQYFNFWTLRFAPGPFGTLLGYAQFPIMSGLDGLSQPGFDTTAATDGIVMGYEYFGSRDKGDFPDLDPVNGYGRTTTHEAGHYFGLRHIWGDGGCGIDDFCEDTPESDASNRGCPTSHTSCGSVDMVENYMD